MAPRLPILELQEAVQSMGVVPASGQYAMAGASQQVGQAVDQVGTAFEGIRTREDAVARVRDYRAATLATREELRRIQTEEDISNPAVVQAYAAFVDNAYGEALSKHVGSPDSRARLLERLEEDRGSLVDQASITSTLIGRQMVEDEYSTIVSEQSARAQQDPESFMRIMNDANSALDDFAPALSAEQEEPMRRNAQAQIVASAVSGLVDRGAYDRAEALMLSTPEVNSVLDPDTNRRLRGRIAEARYKEGELERNVAQIETIVRGRLGRGLTQGELQEALGISQPKGNSVTIQNEAEAPPAHWRYVRDAQGRISHMEPVPGGLAERELAQKEREIAAKEQEAATKEGKVQDIDMRKGAIVGLNVERGLQLIEEGGAGALSAISRHIPGSDAYNLEATLSPIRANIGFGALQEMRQSSPTGGALGPVSDTENKLLQETLGSLDVTQDPAILRENLTIIKELMLNAAYGSPAEVEAAIADGSMTEDQAAQISRDRQTIGLKVFGEATPDAASGDAGSEEAGAPPEGVSPEEWQHMTPDERALWQN